MQHNVKAFSLIEMLVVLVIISATSVLLIQGMETTWRNFSKLNTQDLAQDYAALPTEWFAESVDGALLSHPNRVVVKGQADFFEFTTFKAPHDPYQTPQKVVWEIINENNQWILVYRHDASPLPIRLTSYNFPIFFRYWVDNSWQNEFPESSGIFPEVVTISSDNAVLVTAVIGRPFEADMPPELPVFGEYDYGS